MCLLWLAYTVCHPFLTIFWFSFLFWLAPLRGWALLDGGLCLSSAHPIFLLPSPVVPFLLRSCLPQSCWASLGPPIIFLPMAQYSYWLFYYITSGLGRPWPICFYRASLALFLSLHSHWLLLSSLDFPSPIALFLILGVHGFAINP